MMHTVSEILGEKDGAVIEIDGGATVFEAVKAMVEANVGALLVTDGTEIAGIFTERDYLRRVTLQDRGSHHTAVRDVMTRRLVWVQPEETIDNCMTIMTRERIRHLPVLVEGRVVGMISIGDLVKFVAKQQEVEIRYLKEYISGPQ